MSKNLGVTRGQEILPLEALHPDRNSHHSKRLVKFARLLTFLGAGMVCIRSRVHIVILNILINRKKKSTICYLINTVGFFTASPVLS